VPRYPLDWVVLGSSRSTIGTSHECWWSPVEAHLMSKMRRVMPRCGAYRAWLPMTFVSGILRPSAAFWGREQFADRHKTVARLPAVADVASEWSSRHRKATGPFIHCIAAFWASLRSRTEACRAWGVCGMDENPLAFEFSKTRTICDAFDQAWAFLQDLDSDLTEPPKSLAARTILAKRIIEMADQGLMDVTELRNDALAFLQHNPPFRLIAKGSENHWSHGSLARRAMGKAVETVWAASSSAFTRRMKRPTPGRARYSPRWRSTYVPHGKAETARALLSRIRCSVGHRRKCSQKLSGINCVAATIQLTGRELATFDCSVDRRFGDAYGPCCAAWCVHRPASALR